MSIETLTTETTETTTLTGLSPLTLTEIIASFNMDVNPDHRVKLHEIMELANHDLRVLVTALMERKLTITSEGLGLPTLREGGPRGQTPRVAAAHDRLRASFLELAGREGGVTTNDLNDLAHSLPRIDGDKAWEYHYIKTVAVDLIAEGRITETKKGRQAIWKLVA
jgi:hypothetical protein